MAVAEQSAHPAKPASSFIWKDAYKQQLEHIAETDTLPEGLDWPSLKEAIKHQVRETSEAWGHPGPQLHPAAHTVVDGQASEGRGLQPAGPAGTLQSRFQTSEAGLAAAAAAGVQVTDADYQSFYPAKTKPPPGRCGSWGRVIETAEAMRGERDEILEGLDEFQSSPPFTIQRIAEIVLQPKKQYRTLPKYLSALRRLLSVTAAWDAFPASPGSAAPGASNGITIHPANGSTHSASMSPASTPMFSPIPFLVRDAAERAGLEGEEGQAAAAATLEEIPVMELSGADRTTPEGVEAARLSGAGVVAPGASTHDPSAKALAGAGPTTSTAGPSVAASASANLAGATSAAGSGGEANVVGSLGIPSGKIDELDDPAEHPLAGASLPVKEPMVAQAVEDGLDAEDARSIKRSRSEASFNGAETGDHTMAGVDGNGAREAEAEAVVKADQGSDAAAASAAVAKSSDDAALAATQAALSNEAAAGGGEDSKKPEA